METLKHKVLQFLQDNHGRFLKTKEIARALEIRGEHEYRALRSLLHALADDHQVERGRNQRYGMKAGRSTIVGRIHINRQGYGIVEAEEPERREVYIASQFLKTALDGDLVEVSLFARPFAPRVRGAKDRRVEGEIIAVLKRQRSTVVGRLEHSKNFHFVVPDDRSIPRDIYIPRDSLSGARHGDKVVVALEPWESEHLNPEGRVIEVLGQAGVAKTEVLSVARAFGLPTHFPSNVLQEAKRISSSISDSERHRLDLRDIICFTIDPEDAKDFDDAVSLEVLPDGNGRLGVHIADVSHYVKEGSALDQEALKRGTSVYLVNEVIPMLPEKLSNDVCSLKPQEDRLTYSVFMTVTPQGTVKDYEIEKSVIRSKRRFTYEEVQKILDTGKGEHADILREMQTLSRILLQKRLREGGIDFETVETKFRFDKEGFPLEIIKKVRLDSHRLVEEFMLLANQTVAKHIGMAQRGDGKRPFIYRIHDSPDPERLRDLSNFVAKFGHKLHVNGVNAKAIEKLIESVRGTPEEYVINEVAIRSMAKAVYSEKNIGHFGLGFNYYTHFTSPIRRYPDLVVHRLLYEYSEGMKGERRVQHSKRLPSICQQSSDMERRAIEAERESVKVKQVEYMARHLGDELEGIISSVTNFGLFVEINDLLIEGLVRMRDLGDDYYVYDEKNYALIGRRTRKRYRLGDKIAVQVVRVDLEEREIDFRVLP
jgi:ribonuclease R